MWLPDPGNNVETGFGYRFDWIPEKSEKYFEVLVRIRIPEIPEKVLDKAKV